MDRLTFEGNFCDIARCNAAVCPCGGSCTQKKVWERLKYYEDLEEQGRLVVLPVAEGTTVYTTRWWDDVPETCTDSKGKKFQRMTMRHKVTKDKFQPFGLDYIQFGTEVFLASEEAEAALKEWERGDRPWMIPRK